MRISVGWIFLPLLLVLIDCSELQAENLGVIGKVYPIAEKDLLVVIQEQLQSKVDSGEWQAWLDKGQERAKAYADRPPAVGLPRAATARKRQYNPALRIPNAIRDADGRVIFPPGTEINPLDQMTLTRQLLFFDGDDALQLQWAMTFKGQSQAIPILTRGSVIEVSKAWGSQVYFDQRAYLTEQFGIKQLPARVYQASPADRVLTIEEIVLQESDE